MNHFPAFWMADDCIKYVYCYLHILSTHCFNKCLATLLFHFFQKVVNNALRELSALSLKTIAVAFYNQGNFFLLCIIQTQETNLLPLLALKDTQCSVTSIIKLLQRQTLRASGYDCLGKCFEFFMKCT